MDVTSLLNSTASAECSHKETTAERSATPPFERTTMLGTPNSTPSPRDMAPKRTAESSTAQGSRIPWDAGGYSLALALETKSSSTAGRPPLFAESPIEAGSPRSPWHKVSESHSSRSSHASSSSFWSQAHSRYSSISTVNGLPTIPDVSTLEIAAKMGNRPQLDSPSKRDTRATPFLDLPAESSPPLLNCPISPSDAVMITRGMPRGEAEVSNTGSIRHSGFGRQPQQSLHVDVDTLAKHKRTISAPDFAALDSKSGNAALMTSIQPDTPSSDSSDTTPTYNMDTSMSLSERGEKVSSEDSQEQIKCMYVDNCDTNSSLRKAISHIFGRNKLCTRMIPAHVWVHYCRKHYQRSRYRNAQEYAKLQADLVQRQVTRIQTWSDTNKVSGQGSVVVNWSVSMRKREQNRVQEKSKKRSLTGDSDEEEDCADRAVANGTAVPDWLRNKCGEGYSTLEIKEITARLKENVDNGTLSQIPDVEILPNISADPSEDGRSRGVLKRKPSTIAAHRRAHSVSVRVGMTGHASDGQAVQGIPFVRTDQMGEGFPSRKRQRSESLTYSSYYAKPSELSSPDRVHYSNPVAPLSYGLPYRPALAHVGENYGTSPYADDAARLQSGHPQLPSLGAQQGRSSHMHPLSPPRGLVRPRGFSHGRSHSEVAAFNYHSNDFTFRSPPSSSAYPHSDHHQEPSSAYGPKPYGYDNARSASSLNPPPAYHQAPRSAHEQAHIMHRLPPWTPPTSATQAGSDRSLLPPHRHARNLSTPVAYRNSPHREAGSLYDSHAPMVMKAASGINEPHHLYHRR